MSVIILIEIKFKKVDENLDIKGLFVYYRKSAWKKAGRKAR